MDGRRGGTRPSPCFNASLPLWRIFETTLSSGFQDEAQLEEEERVREEARRREEEERQRAAQCERERREKEELERAMRDEVERLEREKRDRAGTRTTGSGVRGVRGTRASMRAGAAVARGVPRAGAPFPPLFVFFLFVQSR